MIMVQVHNNGEKQHSSDTREKTLILAHLHSFKQQTKPTIMIVDEVLLLDIGR